MPQNLELGPLWLRIKPDVGPTLNAIKGVQGEVNRLGAMSSRLALTVTAPVAAAAIAAMKAFSDFDDAMTASLSIYGKVSADIRSKMESTARAISERTRTTATEIAKGYGVLISAGFALEQSMQAVAVAERFATASFMELDTATTLLAQSQFALGLAFEDPVKNMRQMQRVADVLSMANAKAAGTIEQFARALASKGAPALRAASKSLEEGVAALMVYAERGRHAEIAGELLNVTLRELDTVSRKFAGNWRKFGVAIYDSRGNMRKLWEILGDMEKRLSGMSPQAKAATLAFLGFTDLSSTAIKTLLGTSGRMKEFYEDLQNSAGKTAQIAGDRLKSFASQVKITWNQLTGVAIDVGGVLAPALGVVNDYLRHGIKLWKSLSDEQKKFTVAAVGVSAVLSPALKLMKFAKAGGVLMQWPILLAGAGYAFVQFTETGRKAFETVAAFAKPATDVIKKAFTGVKDALSGGDLRLAWEITTTAINLSVHSMLEGIFGDADSYLSTITNKLVKGDFAGAWNTVLLEIGAQFDALWSASIGALSEFVASAMSTWKSAVDGLTQMIIDADVTGTFKRQKEESARQSAEMIAILERQKTQAEAALQIAVGAGDAEEIEVQKRLIAEASKGIARHRNDISGYLEDVKKYAGGTTSQVANSVNAAMKKIRDEQAAVAEEGRRLAELDQKGSGKEVAKRKEDLAKRMAMLNAAAADMAKKAAEQEENAAEQTIGLKDELDGLDGKTYNAQIGVTGVSRAEAIAVAWFSRVSAMRDKFNRAAKGTVALPNIAAPNIPNVQIPNVPAIGGDGAALMGDRAVRQVAGGGQVAASPIENALKEATEASKAADFALASAQDNLTQAAHRYNEALAAQNAAVGAQREEAARAAEAAAGAQLKAERDLEKAKESATKRAGELAEVKAKAESERAAAPTPRGMEIPNSPIGDKAVDTMLKASDRIQAQMERAQEAANGRPIDLSRQQVQLDRVNANIRKRMSRMNGPLKANPGVDKRINKLPIPPAGEPRVQVPLIPDFGAGIDGLGADYLNQLHGESGIPAPTPAPVPQSTVRLDGDVLSILERIAVNTGKQQITLQQTEVA